jgi:hypothetical protein
MASVIKCLPLLILCYAAQAWGQCPSYKYQPEVQVSYGRLTADEASASLSDAVNGVGRVHTAETYSSGPAFVTIRYFIYSCLAFGVTGGYVNQKGATTEGAGSLAFTSSTYNTKVATIGIEAYYIYKFRKYLDYYTSFGFGPSFASKETVSYGTPVNPVNIVTTSRRDAFSLHYTPIGIRFGGRLGGFAELGVGYKGLFSTGLSYRFGRPWCKG